METTQIAIVVAVISVIGTVVGASIVTLSQWFISKRERIDKFKIVALEKRLAIHQEAYTLWTELISVLHDSEKNSEVVIKCQDWWSENCLYLDSKSRDAFKNCYMLVYHYEEYKKNNEAKETFDKIIDTGKYLAEGVNLPSLGEDEGKTIK
jgi:hypothetical protein